MLRCTDESSGVVEVVRVLAGSHGDAGVPGYVRDTLHLNSRPLGNILIVMSGIPFTCTRDP